MRPADRVQGNAFFGSGVDFCLLFHVVGVNRGVELLAVHNFKFRQLEKRNQPAAEA